MEHVGTKVKVHTQLLKQLQQLFPIFWIAHKIIKNYVPEMQEKSYYPAFQTTVGSFTDILTY